MPQQCCSIARPSDAAHPTGVYPFISSPVAENFRASHEGRGHGTIKAKGSRHALPFRSRGGRTSAQTLKLVDEKCCFDWESRMTTSTAIADGHGCVRLGTAEHIYLLNQRALEQFPQTVFQPTGFAPRDASHRHDIAFIPPKLEEASVDRKCNVWTACRTLATAASARPMGRSRSAEVVAQPYPFPARLVGRDASHRTRNLDTHLTHGCIQHFRHFLRVRFECKPQTNSPDLGYWPNSKSTPCILRGAKA